MQKGIAPEKYSSVRRNLSSFFMANLPYYGYQCFFMENHRNTFFYDALFSKQYSIQ